jgi:integrase
VVRQNGKTVWVNGGHQPRAARELHDILATRGREGKIPTARDCRFSALVERYLEHGTHDLKSQTISTYKSRLDNHLLPYFSEMKVRRSVSTDAIGRWIAFARHSGASDKTVRRCLVTLSAVMSYAVRINLVSENPCGRLRPPKATDYGGVEFTLAPEQLNLLIQNTPRKNGDRVLMMFLCHTAVRPSEASECRWSDISFQEGLVIISRTAVKKSENNSMGVNPTKNGKVRRVPLTPSLKNELGEWKRESGGGGEDLVFPTVMGKRRDMQRWARDTLRPALTRAGLAVPQGSDCNYITRKSWITNALTNPSLNISLKMASEIVGSSPATLLRHYTKVRQQDAHDAMNRMDAMMAGDSRDTKSVVA